MGIPYREQHPHLDHVFAKSYATGREAEIRVHPETDGWMVLVWPKDRWIPFSAECDTLQDARFTARREAMK